MIDFRRFADPRDTCSAIEIRQRTSAPITDTVGRRRSIRMLLVFAALMWGLVSVLIAAWLVNG